MTLARMLLATAFVASAPVWVGCSSDDPAAPVPPVVLTGSWTGTVQTQTRTCSLNLSITEDNNGNVTGTADLRSPCEVVTLTVTGTNNTGGVPDSVELNFSQDGNFFTFNGNFDGVDAMSGLITGAGGCTGTLCPTSFTR